MAAESCEDFRLLTQLEQARTVIGRAVTDVARRRTPNYQDRQLAELEGAPDEGLVDAVLALRPGARLVCGVCSKPVDRVRAQTLDSTELAGLPDQIAEAILYLR